MSKVTVFLAVKSRHLQLYVQYVKFILQYYSQKKPKMYLLEQKACYWGCCAMEEMCLCQMEKGGGKLVMQTESAWHGSTRL